MKIRTGISLFLTVISSSLFSQAFDSTAYKYANEIKAETLKKHLEIIASDEYEGRETGKKGQKMTMEYLIKNFKEYGIKDYNNLNYRQEYPLVEQMTDNITLTIGEKELELFKDFFIRPSFIKNQELSGSIKFYAQEEDAKEGSNLFVWKKDTASSYIGSIKEQVFVLRETNAKCAFYYDEELTENLEKYSHYYKDSKIKLASDLEKEELLLINLTDSGFDKFLKQASVKRKKLDKSGSEVFSDLEVPFKLNINKPTKNLMGENVLAYIEGGDKKDELIVITAHYDHLGVKDSLIYNGADDDGTGTVSLLEIAESFMLAQKDGFKPRRSILIMPVSGEEKGLLGSRYYTDHPVFPLESTVANLNIDMIGRYDKDHADDSNYVYLIGADRLSQDLHDISEEANKTYTDFNIDYKYNKKTDPNRFYYRSDHYNFAKNDIPVIFYFSGVHEDYHRATDTVEKIDYDKTRRVAQLVFYTAWELANREERIRLNKDKEEEE